METPELRPLSLGELLDRTFTLYRNNFWLFVGIMAIPSSFALPMNFFLFMRQGSPLAGVMRQTPQAQVTVFSLGFLGLAGLFWIVYSLAIGAATYAVADAYLGRRITVVGAYSRTRRKFWRLLGVVFNVGLRVFGIFIGVIFVAALAGGVIAGAAAAGGGAAAQTTMAIIISLVVLAALVGGGALAIYLALRYAVSIPALLLEDLRVLAAIRRSVQLTAGYRGRLFLASLLTVLISYVGVIVFQGPFWVATVVMTRNGHAPGWLNFATAASGAVGGAITGPLFLIVLVLCYYDTRIRKEAFDLQFLMSSLDGPAQTPGTVSPA